MKYKHIPRTVLTWLFLPLLYFLFLNITSFLISPNPANLKTYGSLLTKSQSTSWVIFLLFSRSLFVSSTSFFSSICFSLHCFMEGILGYYAGIICECGKRTNNGSQEALVLALILSLANNLILEEILFPTGNMMVMDPMLSEVTILQTTY